MPGHLLLGRLGPLTDETKAKAWIGRRDLTPDLAQKPVHGIEVREMVLGTQVKDRAIERIVELSRRPFGCVDPKRRAVNGRQRQFRPEQTRIHLGKRQHRIKFVQQGEFLRLQFVETMLQPGRICQLPAEQPFVKNKVDLVVEERAWNRRGYLFDQTQALHEIELH